MAKRFLSILVWSVFFSALWASAFAANFTEVASFGSYGPWGACVWNGRIYVGFYVGHTDLPLYRSGVNNDSFSFVRNLGRGESIPRLWVSPGNTVLNATTEGLSGSEQSPAVHWWTTDSANAQSWSSETFGTGSQYRWGLAALVNGNDEYMGFNQPSSACLALKRTSLGSWSQYGPLVTPTEGELILELVMFNGQLYAGGGVCSAYTQPDCARVVRYTGSGWE